MREQEAPFTVKLELTEGCNLYCSFCGLQGIREKTDKTYKFMTLETAEIIASQIAALGWSSRFEMTLRGEPSLNPERAEIIRIFRKHLPKNQLMMTSNGGGLVGKPGVKDNLTAMFEAGLNILALDDYKSANIVPKIREHVYYADERANGDLDSRQEWVSDLKVEVYEYPVMKAGNPYRRHKPTYRMITFLKDIAETAAEGKGVRDNLSNHCGAGGELNDRMAGKRCARPFRELAIRFDGHAMLCCNDWRGDFKIGSVIDFSVEEVWQSDAFNAARQKLVRGERDFGPCRGCDSKSFRAGLLPDPMGKAKLPPPDSKTARTLKEACAGPSLTAAVLRPWEK